MEQYTTIPKEISKIKGNNKLEMALVIAYIKSLQDYKTGITETTREWIAQETGITFRTVKAITPKLQDYSFLFKEIETKSKMPNKYHFKETKENFFYIYNRFFKEDIDTKVKGLLLLIKSVCKQESNKYICDSPQKGGLNYSELARKIGIDIDTLRKYMVKAIEAKQIKLIDKGLLITNKSIVSDFIRENDKDTKTYHIIYDWCIDNDIVPPDRNDEITQMADGEIRRKNSSLLNIAAICGDYTEKEIRNWLTKKITSKPKGITLEYILSMLNMKKRTDEPIEDIVLD